MDRGKKKFGHGHGHASPPIPLRPSFKRKNNIGDASKEAEKTVEPETVNQASQDLEQDAKKLRRLKTERSQKKFGHGLPPIPLPPSFNGKNNIGDASKEVEATMEPETENQAPRDPEQEAKKIRRVLASRQYSQKYRLKQLHYIMQLETEVKALQAQVAISSPRIKYVDCQNSLLRAENGSMKQKLSVFSRGLAFKEGEYEELKRERQILKQLYMVFHQHLELVNPTNQGFN